MIALRLGGGGGERKQTGGKSPTYVSNLIDFVLYPEVKLTFTDKIQVIFLVGTQQCKFFPWRLCKSCPWSKFHAIPWWEICTLEYNLEPMVGLRVIALLIRGRMKCENTIYLFETTLHSIPSDLTHLWPSSHLRELAGGGTWCS